MKIDNFKVPTSSFFSIEKDLDILIGYMLKDETLKKLLWYSVKDAIRQPNLTEEETYKLIGKCIKIIPKIKVDADELNYVIITFDDFSTNPENPEFRNNMVNFDILCHYDNWQLEDFQLRPFRIAAQIDSIMKNVKLTNMGKTYFIGCKIVPWNGEFGGVTLMYSVIHGGEDSHRIPSGNADDEKQFIADFNKLFNNFQNE